MPKPSKRDQFVESASKRNSSRDATIMDIVVGHPITSQA